MPAPPLGEPPKPPAPPPPKAAKAKGGSSKANNNNTKANNKHHHHAKQQHPPQSMPPPQQPHMPPTHDLGLLSQGEPPTPEDARRRGVSLDGLLSLRHQQLVRRVKAAAGEHRRRLPRYCERYRGGESVLGLAREVDYPPYLLARMMVEELCLLPGRTKVTELMRTPALIPDARLRAEVEACIEQDGDFSPGADRVSRSMGAFYERELALRLRALAVPFEDEETLRARGLPKTPDVRLLVPLGLVDRDGKQHVVNWIDSKAMYGSRETYLSEVLPQVTRYVNRFGPGCVVFWWGFDESLRALPSTQHHHVVLLDDFPPRCGGDSGGSGNGSGGGHQLVFLGGGGMGGMTTAR